MHIPVGQPVSLTLQTPTCSPTPCYLNGVIHSFWIPALNGKKDVVPGPQAVPEARGRQARRRTWASARSTAGSSHADMRMRVIAQTPRRLPGLGAVSNSAQDTTDGRARSGVNNTTWQCASCHSFEAGKPGAVAPNLAHLADRTAFAGDKYLMNYDNLWKWIYDAPEP